MGKGGPGESGGDWDTKARRGSNGESEWASWRRGPWNTVWGWTERPLLMALGSLSPCRRSGWDDNLSKGAVMARSGDSEETRYTSVKLPVGKEC